MRKEGKGKAKFNLTSPPPPPNSSRLFRFLFGWARENISLEECSFVFLGTSVSRIWRSGGILSRRWLKSDLRHCFSGVR